MYLLALLLQAVQPAPVAPSPPPPIHGGPQEMTCPVGGEHFSAWQPLVYSTYGERPDGKPYSYLEFPFPLPECPGNKLIMFDDFAAKETATLARVITTPEYRQLLEADTSYYRAYWLATALGRPKPQALGLLLSAIWQVSPGGITEVPPEKSDARLARYQAEFIDEVDKLSPAVDGNDQIWLRARAANAARQMKQFREAERLRKQAENSLANLSEKRGWDQYLSKLRNVIARSDAGLEPLDMIPEQEVASTCIRRQSSNAFDRAACDAPKVAALIAKFRKSTP